MQKGWEATLKSTDTEEWIDLLFYRPIGYRWALLFRRLGVTPNAITIASIFLGIVAGILFYYNDLLINIIGMCLLVWANMYDSADGQLARMTGQKSEIGRILDGVSGDFWFISIYVAICLRLTPEWGYWIWLLAAVAGFSHSKQAAMADYYRNVHLFFLKGKYGSELIIPCNNASCIFRCHGRKTWCGKHSLVLYGLYAFAGTLSLRLSRFFCSVTRNMAKYIRKRLETVFVKVGSRLMKYQYSFIQYTCYRVVYFVIGQSALDLFLSLN